jgi:predicted DCC family thiol-disulfide oxidoreductase YuxK
MEALSPMRSGDLAALEPGHPVLLFDGVCNLCDGTVGFLIARDRQQRLRFAALQSASGRALLARHGLADEQLESVLLVEEGRVHRRSTAVLRAVRYLQAPWRWLSWLRAVPRPLRDAVYAYVARHRYRWFGQRAACRLPTPSERERFLP